MKSLWIRLVLILFVIGLSLGDGKGWAADWKAIRGSDYGGFPL